MEEYTFHKAVKVKFGEGVTLDVTFSDGYVKRYDMSRMYGKYPQLKALEDRALFESGELYYCMIVWNEELDFSTDSIYECGETVRKLKPFRNLDIGQALAYSRAERDISQVQLAEKVGMDQSDISKIERGVSNPSVNTLRKLADALDCDLVVKFESKKQKDQTPQRSPLFAGEERG